MLGTVLAAGEGYTTIRDSTHDLLGFTVLETGPCFAGIEFDGGVGVLLTRPTGASSSPPAAD